MGAVTLSINQCPPAKPPRPLTLPTPEICTGAVPVRGRMRPLQVPTDCPAEVAQLVEQCMSADPQARPTAQQLVERLLAAPGSPVQGTAPAAGARRTSARRSMEAGRPAGQAAAAAMLALGGRQLGSRASSTGDLASPGSPAGAKGRPPRPRSETNLPALATQHALAAPQAAHATQPAPPALPAVREESEILQLPQARQAQQAAHPPSPRPTSPLAPALSVASDGALTGTTAPAAQVAAAVVGPAVGPRHLSARPSLGRCLWAGFRLILGFLCWPRSAAHLDR